MNLYHFPADLSQIIDEVAGVLRQAQDERVEDERALAKSVLELSDLFIGRSPWQGQYGSRPALRHAYLRYFLPVNLPKLHVPLAAWRAAAGRLPETLRCLDLGSGPGTALLGLADFIRELPADERPERLELVALDQSYESLKDAEALLERFARREPRPAIELQALRSDLVVDRAELFPLAAAGGKFDLVLAANVLCEVVRAGADGFDRAVALVAAAADQLLSPTGAILIVEPGLRETSRDLHRLRDRLIAEHGLHIVAPCLHEAPCPALATDRDWCIADLAWEPPQIVRAIDQRTGLRKGSLKFSYLVLRREAAAPVAGRWRVVSDVLDFKGEQRVYLCAEGRWIVVGRLKRDGVEPFEDLQRGDLIEVQGLQTKGSIFRLPRSGTIRRITAEDPAGAPTRDFRPDARL